MAFDVIVFNQEELLTALRQGIKSIALCDNTFSLPDIDGIQYTIIGNVIIENADKPSEEPAPAYANVEHKMMAYSSSFDTSHSSSYGYGSYESGSYQGGSYAYEYEYEYGSFSASYASSYVTSYETSFTSSYYSFISGMTFSGGFGGSFSLLGSYGGPFMLGYIYGFGSFGGSYGGSYSAGYGSGGSFSSGYAPLEDIIEFGSSGIIFVNGYGINLI